MFKLKKCNFLTKLLVSLVFLSLLPNLTSFTDANPVASLDWKTDINELLAKQGQSIQRESIRFELELDWHLDSSFEQTDVYTIQEFIRKGDDINNWKELLTIHNFVLKPSMRSPATMFNQLQNLREQECPNSTRWTILKQENKSILFEWQSKPCLGWPSQHEIARIIDGKYNRFLLRYTAKVYQLEASVRATWIDRFSQAAILLKEVNFESTQFSWTEDFLQPSKTWRKEIRDLIFQNDREKAPNCQERKIINIKRNTPLLLEEGQGRLWLHHLERWTFERCGQSVTYLAWYTIDDIHQKRRLIVSPLDQAEPLAQRHPAFRELLQYQSTEN